MADDKLEVTHLMGKKLDKPIILKWKSETKKNKMEAVAQMFGKKLNEPFTIKGELYVFDEKGFGHGNEHGVACHVPDILERLLAGQVKIDE